MSVPDIAINAFIFLVTVFLLVRAFRRDGCWSLEQGKTAMRYFTCQSNLLCAVAALLCAITALPGPIPRWIWTLKYIGTAAVTVTFLTVFLFLAPSIGKDWAKILLTGASFFMHLLTPLLAIFSFCFLEKQGMAFPESLWGLLPLVLYGPLYLYRTVYDKTPKRWDDFYGFNKSGKWPLAFALMLLGTFLACQGLMALQNA